MNELELARARREQAAIDLALDEFIDTRLSEVQLAAPISPRAKVKLKGILKHYAKEPHPFRACVKDNLKRFGPGRTEAICATLKDTIRGRKDWRGKNNPKDHGAAGLSDVVPVIDADVLLALDAISEHDLQEILLEARALEEHGTREAVSLLDASGRAELERLGGAI